MRRLDAEVGCASGVKRRLARRSSQAVGRVSRPFSFRSPFSLSFSASLPLGVCAQSSSNVRIISATNANVHEEVAARRAPCALRRLDEELGVRVSSVDVPDAAPLARFAAAAAFGEFTAAYLAFGLGFDPGAPSPAEMDH